MPIARTYVKNYGQHKTDQGPAHRHFSAPAKLPMTEQQAPENQPGKKRKHGFVRELKCFIEQRLGEKYAAYQRCRQHQERDA